MQGAARGHVACAFMVDFDAAWALAQPAKGWLTQEQGHLLWTTAAALPPESHVVEIGSYEGRSTMLLGLAVRSQDGTVTAVDPFPTDWKFGADGTRAAFEANISRTSLSGTVNLVPDASTRLRPSWTDGIDLLYIDGKHDYWTVADDLQWAEHVRPGGQVLLHDCFSSVGVTTAVLAKVLPGRGLSYRRRVGSLAVFAVTPPGRRDRLRILGELPWWVRNMVVKLALRLRAFPVARALGHDGVYDPF